MITVLPSPFLEHRSIEISSQLNRRTHLIPPPAGLPHSESDFREFGNPLMSQSDASLAFPAHTLALCAE